MSEKILIETWPRSSLSDQSKIRKSVQTRQKILDSALQHLWSNSFRDLTVAGLTKRAGTSRTSFYQYFKDLHSLMEELLNNLEWEILSVAKPWVSGDSDPAMKLSEALYGLVNVCHDRGPILRAIYEAAPTDERLEQSWNDFVQVFDDAVTFRIEQDQAAGLALPFDARSVAVALNRMDVGVLIHNFGRNPRSEILPVYQAIERIWLSTIYGKFP